MKTVPMALSAIKRLKGKSYILVVLILIYASSCKKDDTASTGSASGGGSAVTSITYVNNTPEPVNITVNGQSQVINAGSDIVVKGTPGAASSGNAYTSGRTSSGAQVGLKIAWTINDKFPGSGNFISDLNVGSAYFFLKLVNNSVTPVIRLYVNYGLLAQTTDNIIIPNDGNIYNIGFYNAYSNSNVRAESNAVYWYWPVLNLSGSSNQSVTVTAN
jgi:hypothetical protein